MELLPEKYSELSAIDVFKPSMIEEIIASVREQATSFALTAETPADRKEIASLAHKVARSKTFIDGLGKDLVSDWKSQAKEVDGLRKRFRDELDAIKAEVRRPLTAWEQTEEERVSALKTRKQHLVDLGKGLSDLTIEQLRERLAILKGIDIDASFQEFRAGADEAKAASLEALSSRIELVELRAREQAEEARKAAEEAKRQQAERDEQIRAEAAAKAEREAARKIAEAEEAKKRAEREAQQEKERAEVAEQAASEQARLAKEAADRAEAKRVEDEANLSASANESFEKWWYEDGSGIGLEEGEDMEEHAKRVAKTAWMIATNEERKKHSSQRS